MIASWLRKIVQKVTAVANAVGIGILIAAKAIGVAAVIYLVLS